jgi:site-specific DNA recombinase
LSFAQFETEVTGERVRDKVAQSKARGLWMGENIPLGYVVKDRKLEIIDDEVDTVRHIYRRYLALGSVPALIDELSDAGMTSQARMSNAAVAPKGASPSPSAHCWPSLLTG